MLVLAMLLAACAVHARDRPFNVTYLDVPHIVPAGQEEVEMECRYDADFTLLTWFQGSHEFFRYKPGAAPSTRSYPIIGVGSVEMLSCGPVACQLRLGALTEDATGLYRCDIERDVPPYKFDSKQAYMEVRGHEQRKPLLEGLADEYKAGDVIEAYCRGSPDSELRWYINGKEIVDFRGSTYLRKISSRLCCFMGVPLTMVVQCAEFKYGHIYGSVAKKVRWSDVGNMRKKVKENEEKNESNSSVITAPLALPSILLCCLVKIFYV